MHLGQVFAGALIGAAQRVEHYEIAAYGTLRTFAQTLGLRQEAKTLQQTLDEEAAADEKLSNLATAGINEEAASGETSSTRSGRRARSSNGRSRSSQGRSRSTRSRSTNAREAKSNLADGPTKEELLQRARELEIEGRSQMSKTQLRRAVSRAAH